MISKDDEFDDCHYIIENLTDDVLWAFFENVPLADMSICINSHFRPLDRSDLPAPKV